jgi:hypothetical protein
VNADRGLRRSAIERGWPMLEFRHPIPLGQRLRDRPAVPVAAAALGVSVGVAIGIMLYGRHRKRAADAGTVDAVVKAGTRANATKLANAMRRAEAMNRTNGAPRAIGTRRSNATSPGDAGNAPTSASVAV